MSRIILFFAIGITSTLVQLPLSIIMEHNLFVIRQRVWKIFSFWVSSKGFGIFPSIHLITNKSHSQGISHSFSLWLLERVGDLDLDAWELWSLMKPPHFTIIVHLDEQLATMCPKPKHLKHF